MGAASVLWVSHEAATPGTEVRIFGTRFGTEGTVSLGGVTVPSGDVLSWTDEQLRFRVPETAPAFGRVMVSNADGADLEARPFFLTKTAAQPSSLADAALDVSTDVVIAQGLTAMPRPANGRTFKVQDPRRFSTDSTPVLLENATLLLHATGRCATDSRLWTIDGLYATHRKATCKAQLDPALAWTVVQSPATELAEPALEGRLHHFSGQLIVSGAQPSYPGLSWRWLQRVTNGELRCDATRSGTFQTRFADVRGFPAQGSLALLSDGTVLRVGDPVQEPGLHHTVALDWNSAWDLRNPSRTAIDADLTSVAAAGTRVVLAGSTFADNNRARLRTSTNGGQTFPVETLGASSLAGTFAPIFSRTERGGSFSVRPVVGHTAASLGRYAPVLRTQQLAHPTPSDRGRTAR